MPLPRGARAISTKYASPFMRRVSGHLPRFATLAHVGRTSGREYRSPVNVFIRGDQAAFALPHGADAQWVLNVLAAGQCRIQTRGRTLRLTDPVVSVDGSQRFVPTMVRIGLRLIRADEFLMMSIAEDADRDG